MKHLFIFFRQICLFAAILISSINVFANDDDRIWVGINVVDKVTNRRATCQLSLYTAQDTTFIYPFGGPSEIGRCQNEFCTPSGAKSGLKYLIYIDNYDIRPYHGDSFRRELERQGKYEPMWVEFTIPEKHDGYIELPTAYMTRPKKKNRSSSKKLLLRLQR